MYYEVREDSTYFVTNTNLSSIFERYWIRLIVIIRIILNQYTEIYWRMNHYTSLRTFHQEMTFMTIDAYNFCFYIRTEIESSSTNPLILRILSKHICKTYDIRTQLRNNHSDKEICFLCFTSCFASNESIDPSYFVLTCSWNVRYQYPITQQAH